MYEDDKAEEEIPAVGAVSWANTTDDEWYLDWQKKIRSEPNRYPRWKLLGGLLYSYRPNLDIEEDLGSDDDAWKMVVPKEEREKDLYECHDDPTAGHLGREKTFARVARYYYWPKYYQLVKEHVRACLICQQCKVEQRAPAGMMGSRNIRGPWKVVAGDITGLLPGVNPDTNTS